MPATQLFVETQPVGQTFTGRPLIVHPKVLAIDGAFNIDGAYVGVVVPTLIIISGAATLGGSEAGGKACAAGVCQFTDLVVTATASAVWYLHFASGALAPTDSAGSAGPLHIGAQKTYIATQLVVTVGPPTLPAGSGTSYPHVPMIAEARSAGNVLDPTVGAPLGGTPNSTEQYPYATLTLNTLSGGPGVVNGPTRIPFIAGELTCRGPAVSAPGIYTYTLRYNGVEVTSAPFTITSAVGVFVNPDNRMRGLGAELPRSTPTKVEPVQAGVVRTVGAGQPWATIQAAWDASNYGDTIRLMDGNTFSESVDFSAKPWAAGWIVIESETMPAPAGQRVKPADFPTQAIWQPVALNNQYTFKALTGASHVWVRGVNMRTNPVVLGNSALCLVGYADGDSLASGVPDTIVLDRCYLHHDDPTSGHTCNRGVRWRASNSSILNSYIIGFQNTSNPDAQGILADNCPGPLLLDNNYIEGESEGFMIGGAGNFAGAANVPRDITVTRNFFTKPIARKGTWAVKNLFELKEGHRGLVEGNIFDGFWDAGVSQPAAVNLKSVSQGGSHAEGFVGTSDWTFRHNFCRNLPSMFSISGAPTGEVEIESRIVIHNNLICGVNSTTYNGNGRLFSSFNEAFDVVCDHITYVSAPKASLAGLCVLADFNAPTIRTTLSNILFVSDLSPSWVMTGTGAAGTINGVTAVLDPTMVVDKLYFTGMSVGSSAYMAANAPAGNTFVDDDGAGHAIDPGFANFGIRATAPVADPLDICDALTLIGGGAFGTGTGGSNIGVKDMPALKAAITGVLTGAPAGGGGPPPPPPPPPPVLRFRGRRIRI